MAQTNKLQSPGNISLINNLKQMMAKIGITENELARRTHIPQPTLHKILAAKTTDPRYSTLQALANFFGLTTDDLYNHLAIAKFLGNSTPNKQTQSVPIIAWENCLNWKKYTDTLNADNWNNWVAIESEDTELYGLSSKPSLEPRFPMNTTLIISPHISPGDGDLIVVHYPNTQEATLRELSIDGPSLLLLPLNPNSSTDTHNEKIKILGVLIQSRFNHHSD